MIARLALFLSFCACTSQQEARTTELQGDLGWFAPDLATDPFAAAPVCTSKLQWILSDVGSPRMHPGKACISCHTERDEGPSYSVAGTVYPTAHEPDDCHGAQDAQVIITDAKGVSLTLTTNTVGNFFWKKALALPYRAKVVQGGRTREMADAQMSGDCNSCHTQSGTDGAPGRILVP